MIEGHKYYTALLLNCYVKQNSQNAQSNENSEKIYNFICSNSFDETELDINSIIEVYRDSKNFDDALLLAEKTKNLDHHLLSYCQTLGFTDPVMKH